MRKRGKAGATEAVASSSGSEAAEEDLFAAEQRLGGDQPAAEPAWSDDDDLQSLEGSDAVSDREEYKSETSDSEAQAGVDTDADSEASSIQGDSPSDDDELDTAIVELAAGTDRDAAKSEKMLASV